MSGRRLGATALSLLAVCVGVGCSRREPPRASLARVTTAVAPNPLTMPTASASAAPSASAQAAPAASSDSTELLPAEERTWSFASTPVGKMSVVVLLPERHANDRFPVLIAMHGRGEAMKGPERGARGWIEDYDLKQSLKRLAAPPLTTQDFKSFVSASRLEQLNHALETKPYRGLVIVCPYTPDMLTGDDPFNKAVPLAEFLVDELLPKVYRETPAIATVASTAIDGVSLGGRAAISVGLLRPKTFGVIAALQAAFHGDQAGEITARALKARAENPALTFRLLTSDGDFFLNSNTLIARSLSAAGVPLQFDVVLGPHDYPFNRGPGGYEMLMFHDRVLRGDPPP